MTQAIERPGADAPVVNKPHAKNKPWPLEFASSAVGKKWIMALSGLALIGFVLVHAFGNLKIYMGAEQLDHYSEALRTLLYPYVPRTWTLWAFRIGLIVAFAAHIWSAYSLTRMNNAARASYVSPYASPRNYIAANFASRTMRWTGIIIGLYVVFHLADLTWGFANPDWVRGDVYENLVHSFQRVPVAIIYILANIALGIHLFHGSWSMFQSMGLNSPQYNGIRRWVAALVAVPVSLVNVSFPLAVTFGLVS